MKKVRKPVTVQLEPRGMWAAEAARVKGVNVELHVRLLNQIETPCGHAAPESSGVGSLTNIKPYVLTMKPCCIHACNLSSPEVIKHISLSNLRLLSYSS